AGETMRQLEPFVRKSLEGAKATPGGADPATVKYFLGSLGTQQLLDLPRNPAVLEAIVTRNDVPDAPRGIALDELATARKTTRAAGMADELTNLLSGIPLIYDPDLRAKAYERTRPLISDPAAKPALRRAAIAAAVSMNREQRQTFAALCALVAKGEEVGAAT